MSRAYLSAAATLSGKNGTPQTQPIPGSNQVKNEAGGYTWEVSNWTRLRRFLGIGSESGNYYTKETKLTMESATAVQKCIAEDGIRVVNEILDFSVNGKGIKNEPCLFALALCMVHGKDLKKTKRPMVNPDKARWTPEGYVANKENPTDVDRAAYAEAIAQWETKNAKAIQAEATRNAAFNAMAKVARTHGDLLRIQEILNQLNHGWGKGRTRATAAWYNEKSASNLAYQLVKYREREGMPTSRIINSSHPKAATEEHNIIYKWAQSGWDTVGETPHTNEALRQIWAYERCKRLTNAKDVAQLVREHRLTHEMIPSNFHGEKIVWEALLEHMPLGAQLRNLSRLTAYGIIAPFSEWNNKIIANITNVETLKKARIHPFQLLKVLKNYEQGRGDKGSLTWKPEQKLVTALDNAFYLSMGAVEPTGVPMLLAVDDSGSMHGSPIGGLTGIDAAMAAAAMALVTATIEPNVEIIGFDERVKDLKIAPGMRLDAVMKAVGKVGAGTDCSLPIRYALQQKYPVQAFGLYTDSQSWAGPKHTSQALVEFRNKTGIPARMYVAQLANNASTLADPADSGQMDIQGFSADCPNIISQFVKGEL